MEDRVAEAEAQAQAIAEVIDEHVPLEREFLDLETKMKIAEELAALKKKIQEHPQQGE
jgi:phage shock protein A